VDVLITEIGGTVGDMEGLLFLEALRQFALEVGKENVCFIHVTLLPYIKAAGEVKTKPTQQSVAKLREIGIQPDIIICRTEADLDEDNRRKIAMFCNVERKNVVAFRDVAHTIYECPLDLRRDKIDRLVVDKIGLGHTPSPALEDWERFVQRVIHPKHKVTIAVAGKYIELQDAYKSIYESLIHAGAHHDTKVQIVRVDTEAVEDHGAKSVIGDVDGILVPGGFGDRGIEGKSRPRNTPARTRSRISASASACRSPPSSSPAMSADWKVRTPPSSTRHTMHPVICLQEEQKGVEDMGATMRLGSCESILFAGTKAADCMAMGPHPRTPPPPLRVQLRLSGPACRKAGLVISSVSAEEGLVEIIELPDHPFYIGAQFHPEFQSKPNHPTRCSPASSPPPAVTRTASASAARSCPSPPSGFPPRKPHWQTCSRRRDTPLAPWANGIWAIIPISCQRATVSTNISACPTPTTCGRFTRTSSGFPTTSPNANAASRRCRSSKATASSTRKSPPKTRRSSPPATRNAPSRSSNATRTARSSSTSPTRCRTCHCL
jgi:CTP synthase